MKNDLPYRRGIALILAVIFGAGMIVGRIQETHDPYAQSTFPCTEDSALVYGAEFGPDKVGCIQLDDLRD